MEDTPTLSICIPTYNRADLLELCLATVLPQLAPHGDRVECVISDNASTDHTEKVVAEYAAQYPLKSFRNQENRGVLQNFLDVAIRHASGEYIWLIGDDDTLNAGSVDRILSFIDQHSPAPDLIALNVGYLPGDVRPSPEEALGGATAEPLQMLRQSGRNGLVPFSELFEGPCADLTAVYSFLLRKRCWERDFGYWQPEPPLRFRSLEETYCHACAAIPASPKAMTGLISEPSVTIYELTETEFSWARYHPMNTLLWASALHGRYAKAGVPRSILAPYRRHQVYRARNRLHKLLWDPAFAGGWKETLHFIWVTPGQRIPLLKLVWDSCGRPEAPKRARTLHRLAHRITDLISRAISKCCCHQSTDAIARKK